MGPHRKILESSAKEEPLRLQSDTGFSLPLAIAYQGGYRRYRSPSSRDHRQVCDEMGVTIVNRALSKDNMRMFATIPPHVSVSDFMSRAKGRPSQDPAGIRTYPRTLPRPTLPATRLLELVRRCRFGNLRVHAGLWFARRAYSCELVRLCGGSRQQSRHLQPLPNCLRHRALAGAIMILLSLI